MKIMSKQIEAILNAIEKYDRIIVFRHTSPDYDALGSQFGVVEYLKHNFSNKEILAPGFTFVKLAPALYPENDVVSDETYDEKPFLALVLDTATKARVSDQNFLKADMIIKIDHHPNLDAYGDINLVRDGCGACAELLTYLFSTKQFKKYDFNRESAKYLFSGIVGDTGRFQYPDTSALTFKMASKLISYGFNPNKEIYTPMYLKGMEDFERTKTVMNCYKISEHGVAYYYLDKKTLADLHLDSDEAKIYLSIFNFHEGIYAWVCFAEDERENNIRCSARSRGLVINEVCARYGGGGHASASGARPKNFEECMSLIDDLDKEVIKQLGK